MTLIEVVVLVETWTREDLVNFAIDRLYSEHLFDRNVKDLSSVLATNDTRLVAKD